MTTRVILAKTTETRRKRYIGRYPGIALGLDNEADAVCSLIVPISGAPSEAELLLPEKTIYVNRDGDASTTIYVNIAGVAVALPLSGGAGSFAGLTATGPVEFDVARTTAGAGLDIDLTINSASASASALDLTAVQLTTARTSGAVNGLKAATTSLAGDLNSVVYADIRCAAPTDGGGTVVHAAVVVEAGHDVALDLSACATGEADIVVGDNLAVALQIREGANNIMQVATTNSAELVTWGYPFAFGATVNIIADPGTGQAIPVTRSGVCMITTGGSGQTNTLAVPTFVGQTLTLVMDVDGGGDRVITVASAFNQAGNTTITLNDAGDTVNLIGARIAGALRWRLVSNDGATLG